MARFDLLYHPKVVSQDIPKLDRSSRERVRVAIGRKLTNRPEEFAKPLAYTRQRLWSLRVGPWRVIFAMRSDELWVLRIGHRSEIYQRLGQRQVPE